MSGRIAVATSGGRDSTALLHATARAACHGDIQVHALHIHHGLLPQADAWARQARRQCARWRSAGLPVHFHLCRLVTVPSPGESVEAWARRERYRALSEMARTLGIDAVLLAHHQRDQAETLLLQALRGAGPAGLAAMPGAALRGGIHWYRPWLNMPRTAIDAYLQRHRLSFVDDASNSDPRFARSRLRVVVWPVLQKAFPDAETTLAAAARRAHEAAACAAELALIDSRSCVDEAGRLCVQELNPLRIERRANLLRQWLQSFLPDGVPESLVQRLLRELMTPRLAGGGVARWPSAGGWLWLYRGLLYGPQPSVPLPPCGGMALDLSQVGVHPAFAWHGSFEVVPGAGTGIPASLLKHASLRARSGGETFQRTALGMPRSLKKQFQAAGIPAWQRCAPLVYAGEQLLFVPGLGVDGRVVAVAGEPTLRLQWKPAGGS